MSDTDKLLALIKQARSDYRASDAAGDVLDWLEERALAQPAEAVEGESRFFIEHDIVHDRLTGKHVTDYSPEELLDVLRRLQIDAQAWRMTAHAFEVGSRRAPTDAAQGAVAEVVETRCGCHPETCCCGDYTLKINGSYAACGSKERMHRIADAVNATHPQAAPARSPVLSDAAIIAAWEAMAAALDKDFEHDLHGQRAQQLRDCANELRSRAEIAGQAAPAPDAVSCNDPMCDQVLRERDQAEEIIDKLCDTVLGTERAEWSSSYFFEDAVEDVKDELHRLRKQAAPAQGDGEQQ